MFAILIAIILIVVSFSFAYWTHTESQVSLNKINSDCLKLEITDMTNAIKLEKAYPMTDEEAEMLSPYTFKIKNVCNLDASYELNLEIMDVKEKLNSDFISLNFNGGGKKILSSYEAVDPTYNENDFVAIESYSLVNGELNAGEEVEYNLKLWMDESVTAEDDAMNKNFISKLTVHAVLGDLIAPSIVFETNGNLVRSLTENEGTIVNVYDNGSGVGELYYEWSKGNSNAPAFSKVFNNGDKINKQANSAAYYLWVKACDVSGNCSVKVSEPYVGVLIADNTVERNRLEVCANSKLSSSQRNILTKVFENRLNSVNTIREKTVMAAKFLAEEFPYQIPYYLNNGLEITQTAGHYYYNGLFINSNDGWGCAREFIKDATETNTKLGFVKGTSYPNGFDCSGLVTWALKNGGVSSNIIGNYGTGNFANYAEKYNAMESLDNLDEIKDKIRIGDLFFLTGHIAMVTDITDTTITLSESSGTSSSGGVQSNTYNFDTITTDRSFNSVIYLCDAYGDC